MFESLVYSMCVYAPVIVWVHIIVRVVFFDHLLLIVIFALFRTHHH